MRIYTQYAKLAECILSNVIDFLFVINIMPVQQLRPGELVMSAPHVKMRERKQVRESAMQSNFNVLLFNICMNVYIEQMLYSCNAYYIMSSETSVAI